jgi:methylglutaconyl-CoA hydratase
MSEGSVRIQKEHGISHVIFFHPQSNSLPGKLLRAMAAAITEADADKDTHVIILRSEGEKAFCAGASFDELVAIENMEQGLHFFTGFAEVINAMRKANKFVIGRIHNKAVGGGVGLASACDYCFATSSASIKLSELAVGIGPFVVGPAVERKVGLSAMSELAINAHEWRSADWAREKGLYNAVLDSEAEMDDMIAKLTTNLVASNPEAMSELKRVFWTGTENWDELLVQRAGISGRLVLSDFTRKAIEKFKKK